jgi:hypothetical protein
LRASYRLDVAPNGAGPILGDDCYKDYAPSGAERSSIFHAQSRGAIRREPNTPTLHRPITPLGQILGLSIARPLELAHVGAMRLFLASLIGAVLANAPAVTACEGCKEPSSVAGNGGVDGISFGFSASVIFMLVMVFGILGGFFWMAARSCRQLEAAHRAAAAQTNWSS